LQIKRKYITTILLILALTGISINNNYAYSQISSTIEPSCNEFFKNTSNSNYLEWNQKIEAEKSFWLFINQIVGINTQDFNITMMHVSTSQFLEKSSKNQIAVSADSISVTAMPDSVYSLDYWLLDGEFAGCDSTFCFTMDDKSSVLEAVFSTQVTRYGLVVNAGDNCADLVPSIVWVDGNFAGYANSVIMVCPSEHLVEIEF
jgi:hypothetical protein